MRAVAFALISLLAIPTAQATADESPFFAFSLGGFSGDETSGIAMGFYSLRPDSLSWYINGTISSSVDDDEDFRPIPSDIRVDSDTDSVTLNIGVTMDFGRVATYFGAGVSQVSEYGLYRTASEAFWYEEEDNTETNFNVGLLLNLHRNIGLDVGANSANEEVAVGLMWRFR